MNVLIGCECSGVIREAFRARGHNAWSCDLKPSTAGYQGPHYECDLFDLLHVESHTWDLFIVHPPCTYLCSSGLHWNTRRPERKQQTEDALKFVAHVWALRKLFRLGMCLENPQGCINTRLPEMPAPQYIQPYDFGEDASKKTGLWLDRLPPLNSTLRILGRFVDGVERWDNQTDSGQNKLGPSEQRASDRARTYPGIANAMAEQWGIL